MTKEVFMPLRRRPETLNTRRGMSDKLQFVVVLTAGRLWEPTTN
jgi:hypothetical protein